MEIGESCLVVSSSVLLARLGKQLEASEVTCCLPVFVDVDEEKKEPELLHSDLTATLSRQLYAFHSAFERCLTDSSSSSSSSSSTTRLLRPLSFYPTEGASWETSISLVSLSGWILGYPVVYVFSTLIPSASCVETSGSLHNNSPQRFPDTLPNCLSSVELSLFTPTSSLSLSSSSSSTSLITKEVCHPGDWKRFLSLDAVCSYSIPIAILQEESEIALICTNHPASISSLVRPEEEVGLGIHWEAFSHSTRSLCMPKVAM